MFNNYDNPEKIGNDDSFLIQLEILNNPSLFMSSLLGKFR